jgi:hypothetical protein
MQETFVSGKGFSKRQALITLLTIKKETLLEIISFLLVLLFVYTAVSKLVDYATFKHQLSQSPFITDFSNEIAWSIPAGEILIALALLYKPVRLLGLYGSLFIMTMFTAYIFAMLRFSYDIPCSCGGVLSKMTWGQHFWFNLFFVSLSIVGIVLEVKRKWGKAFN